MSANPEAFDWDLFKEDFPNLAEAWDRFEEGPDEDELESQTAEEIVDFVTQIMNAANAVEAIIIELINRDILVDEDVELFNAALKALDSYIGCGARAAAQAVSDESK